MYKSYKICTFSLNNLLFILFYNIYINYLLTTHILSQKAAPNGTAFTIHCNLHLTFI